MLNFTHGARSQHSNGLAERMVAVVEEILRTRINYKQGPRGYEDGRRGQSHPERADPGSASGNKELSTPY